MLASDVASLCCVDCGSPLSPPVGLAEDEVVVDAILACPSCGRAFPVLNTVGIFFRRGDLMDFLHPLEIATLREKGWDSCLAAESSHGGNQAQQAVMENWAYQWGELADSWKAEDFEAEGYLGAEAFWSFIPVDKDRVREARVLVCAGGLGRETYHLAKAGPAKILVNEIGVEIYKIARLIPDAGRRLVLMRSDMKALPVPAGSMDVTVCDHALQHVPGHRDAYRSLCQVTRPGGVVAVCVYSHENNWVMTHFIEPMKALFHRLPLKGQRYAALPFAVAIYCLIHGLYKPLGRLARKVLPLYDHMDMWSRQPFLLVWMQCFDLIHAPVSHHFRRAEMEAMARDESMHPLVLRNTNQTLWSLVALRPAQAA